MEWIKIDPHNLPEREVLAANFNDGTYGFREKKIGYLIIDDDGTIAWMMVNSYVTALIILT